MRLLGLAPVRRSVRSAPRCRPSPDLLVTGDGMHLAVVRDGTPLILRDRAGDYVRALFAEASGFDGDPGDLGSRPYSACSQATPASRCIRKGAARWRLLATRSATQIDWATLTRACADADIVVSDRRLPRGCSPRWLKLDRTALRAPAARDHLGDEPGSTRSPTASASTRGRNAQLAVAPHRELASRRIDEMEAPAAGKAEDRLGDDPAGLGHRVERRFEIVDPDHRQRRRQARRPDRPEARRRSSPLVVAE